MYVHIRKCMARSAQLIKAGRDRGRHGTSQSERRIYPCRAYSLGPPEYEAGATLASATFIWLDNITVVCQIGCFLATHYHIS
jgi:hypothetical protein